MMRLRVHHLLCSALYVGKGYSEEFCENMQKVVQWLWEEPRAGQENEGEMRAAELIAGPDSICGSCPNLCEKGCKLDDNSVVSKDEKLALALGLETGHIYSVSELLQIVEKHLTAENFEDSCHHCEWYEQGLCRYEGLAGKYRSRREF